MGSELQNYSDLFDFIRAANLTPNRDAWRELIAACFGDGALDRKKLDGLTEQLTGYSGGYLVTSRFSVSACSSDETLSLRTMRHYVDNRSWKTDGRIAWSPSLRKEAGASGRFGWKLEGNWRGGEAAHIDLQQSSLK